MANTLKETRKEFKKIGKFYTDPKLVDLMYSYVDFNYKNIYDPTCGTGALFSKAKKGTKLYGQEKDPEAVEQAKKNYPSAEIAEGDTLEHPKFLNKNFDLIMANPPFSIK
jgi:type I restriction enzyme M protein